MISELVTNAFLHARTDCLIHAAFDPPTLIVTVTDEDEAEPSAHVLSTTAEGVRGLAIVAGFADNWGTKRLAGGKSIWFHLSNTDQPPPRPVRHL